MYDYGRPVRYRDEHYISNIGKNKHNREHIYWKKEATKYALSIEEYRQFKEELDPKLEIVGGNRLNTVRSVWHTGSWSFDTTYGYYYVCLEACKEYAIFDLDSRYNASYVIDVEKKKKSNRDETIFGADAVRLVQEEFRKHIDHDGMRYKDKGELIKAFGGFYFGDRHENDELIKGLDTCYRCTGPFIWADAEFNGKITNGVQKADISSAYPAMACGLLPTTEEYKVVDGVAEPDEEYRFAFYLKSGHVAEFGRFDTRVDQYGFLYRECRNPENRESKHKEEAIKFINSELSNEKTLLMKASKYRLDETMQHFYDLKDVSNNAKDIMVKSIGAFAALKKQNSSEWFDIKSFYRGHLAIIIHCRHNHRMIELYGKIKAAGGRLISIQTDAMTWLGKQIDEQTDKKTLGAFVTEIIDGRLWQNYCGCYAVDDFHGHSIIKYQGVENFPAEIFEALPPLERMDAVIDYFKQKKEGRI